MTKGFILHMFDPTSCGGRILEGASNRRTNGNPVARMGDAVSCGKDGNTYRIVGGISWMNTNGRLVAGSLDSFSGCPCKARIIPQITVQTYESRSEPGYQAVPAVRALSTEPLQYAQSAKKSAHPFYLTGEKTASGFVPDYPVLRNTQDFPDERLRGMLSQNNQDVMLLTIPEAFEVLQSWGWKETKTAWVETTQSDLGQVLVNYGVNGKDVVTTSMIISKLGSFGIRATVYNNHKGTELIKLTGYPGIRKVLNAPVFALKNPKVVDLGIGKYGLGKSIVEGARLTFYVAAAFRTIDFILNDETHLAQFIGSLATDVVKIGIVSAISWGVGTIISGVISTVAVPLVVVVVTGLVAAIGLNYLDEKFGVTDKVVAYIEAAQQEFVEKAREIEKGLWDLGAMYADRMLDKGREVIEYEVRKYIRDSLSNFKFRAL